MSDKSISSTKDIEYFSEGNMNKREISYFFATLPDHLKILFVQSFPDSVTGYEVLQGYKGPARLVDHSSGDGTELSQEGDRQEISYLWGTSKAVNIFPIIGTLTYAALKALEPYNQWCSLYFDGATGKCVGAKIGKESCTATVDNFFTMAQNIGISGCDSESLRDIDYFSEEKLNARDIELVYGSLPDRFKRLFKESIKTEITPSISLQGYRGPARLCNGQSGDSATLEPRFGVQEIRYWWATSKIVNLIPLIGNVEFIASRISQKIYGEMEWCSMYFDQFTGECFGNNVDEISGKLDQTGCQLFAKGDFHRALDYHQNASNFCNPDSHELSKYLDNIAKAKVEIVASELNELGDKFFSERKYKEAYEKYLDAMRKSQEFNCCTTYSNNVDLAQDEIDAKTLIDEGNRYYSEQEYDIACAKFQEACNLTNVAVLKCLYATKRDKARIICKHISSLGKLWEEACEAETICDSDQSDLANEKFQKILKDCNNYTRTYSDVPRFEEIKKVVALKIEGNDLFNEGIILQNAAMEISKKEGDASAKIEESRDKLLKSFYKFKAGLELDEVFRVSLECVQTQLESLDSLERSNLNRHFSNLKVNTQNSNEISENDTATRGNEVDQNAQNTMYILN